MPYFDLDPKTVMPWDIMGCILFPDDPELAQLAAVNDLIQFQAGCIRVWKKIGSTHKELKKSTDEAWETIQRELEKYGGLDVLARRLSRDDFHKEQRRAVIEGMVAGSILQMAIQINNHTGYVTRKKTFELVEEEISKLEAKNGAIHYRGKRFVIKRSEKRLNDCWRNRSCVAHWWAGYVALSSLDNSLDSNPYFKGNIPTLAAAADAFLTAGSKIMIRDQNGKEQPFIDPEAAWGLGEIWEDCHQVNVTVQLDPLPDWAKERLASS